MTSLKDENSALIVSRCRGGSEVMRPRLSRLALGKMYKRLAQWQEHSHIVIRFSLLYVCA